MMALLVYRCRLVYNTKRHEGCRKDVSTMRSRSKILWTALTGAVILGIFVQSMMPADLSGEESTYALGVIGNILDKVGWPNAALTEHFLRKSAHFAEYMLLGILLSVAIGRWDFTGEKKWFRIALTEVLVPFLDETIQLFVPGRSSQTTDIWIDICGVTAGVLLVHLIRMIGKLCRKRWGRSAGREEKR